MNFVKKQYSFFLCRQSRLLNGSPHLDADPPRWQTPPACRTPPRMQTPPGCRPPRQTPPPLWTEGMTHACENITFLQLLLRAVNMQLGHNYIIITSRATGLHKPHDVYFDCSINRYVKHGCSSSSGRFQNVVYVRHCSPEPACYLVNFSNFSAKLKMRKFGKATALHPNFPKSSNL